MINLAHLSRTHEKARYSQPTASPCHDPPFGRKNADTVTNQQ